MSDARLLCDRAGVLIRIVPMEPAAAVPPPIFGVRKMFVSDSLAPPARPFVILHELAHIVAGDADELVEVWMDERRYPVEDQIADGVAAVAVTTPDDRALPVADLAELLRTLVPVDRRAWMVYRSEAVARLVREPPDLGRWGS